MKKIFSAIPIVVISIFLQNTSLTKKNVSFLDERWTGTMSYRDIHYDTIIGGYACGWQRDTIWSEWRMQADITANKGITKSSFTGSRHGTSADTCINTSVTGEIKETMNASGQTTAELDLGIEYDTKEYGFAIDIPACTGKKISDRYVNGTFDQRIIDDIGQGDSQINVEGQKLKDKNILSGRIEERTRPQKGLLIIQIWEWNLKRVK